MSATTLPAGVVQRRKARSTGTIVDVWDNREGQYALTTERWFTVCRDHGGVCSHDTRAVAVAWSSEPEVWCWGCQPSHD